MTPCDCEPEPDVEPCDCEPEPDLEPDLCDCEPEPDVEPGFCDCEPEPDAAPDFCDLFGPAAELWASLFTAPPPAMVGGEEQLVTAD